MEYCEETVLVNIFVDVICRWLYTEKYCKLSSPAPTRDRALIVLYVGVFLKRFLLIFCQ